MADNGGSALPDLLRTWRERALLTQEQLAGRTGLGVRTIRRLESTGSRRPRSGSVRLLADALELTATERATLVAVARGEPGRHGEPERRVAAKDVPRQLPMDVPGFTGRAEPLRELDGLLAGDGTAPATVVISAIAGTAGVGKTSLALHWAHRVADRFPDGLLYVNLRGFDPSGAPTSPAEAIRGFLTALQVAPDRIPVGMDAQAALYRSLLAGRRVLVVLDNARDAEQVRPLLPGTPGCVAVVTSRNQLTGLVATEGARPLPLALLSTVEARELLARRLGDERVAAEPAAVDGIIAECAGLPLALAIVAGRTAGRPGLSLAEVACELRETRGRLDAFDTEDRATDLRTVFSWSGDRLSPAAARLFRLLGLHPGADIGEPAAASLAGVPRLRVRPMLAELTRANLLTEHTPGRYGFHDLLRAHATELARTTETDDDRRAAMHRVLDHYLHTGHLAARLVNPQREPIAIDPPRSGTEPEELVDHEEALAWFITEHRILVAAVDQAANSEFDVLAWQLAWTLVTYFDRQGHWHDWASTQESALAAARRLADGPMQAQAHRGLAGAHVRLGRYDLAQLHLEHALELAGESGDLVGQARNHQALAEVHGRQARHPESLRHAEEALELYRAAGHKGGEAMCLGNVGWCHAQLGDYRRALEYCQEALVLEQALGDRHGEASSWDSLGYAYHHSGEHRRAIDCYERALEVFGDLGDRWNEAGTLTNLGDTWHAAGHPDEARTAWQQAAAILDDMGHPDADRIRAKL